MKIAEYIDALPSDMVYCSAAINKEYMVQMADEHFYHFFGENSGHLYGGLYPPGSEGGIPQCF